MKSNKKSSKRLLIIVLSHYELSLESIVGTQRDSVHFSASIEWTKDLSNVVINPNQTFVAFIRLSPQSKLNSSLDSILYLFVIKWNEKKS